ncbi:hypothetical protein ACVSQB_19475 [Bradyrhizobium elkanii]
MDLDKSSAQSRGRKSMPLKALLDRSGMIIAKTVVLAKCANHQDLFGAGSVALAALIGSFRQERQSIAPPPANKC